MNFLRAALLTTLLTMPASASRPHDEVPVSTHDKRRPAWGWHDLWNGVTRHGDMLDADAVSHEPYVPAARVPNTMAMRIVGADDLRAVTATTTYPHSAFVKLFVTFPSGMQGGCSGTMVSPSTVLTAAHCVFSHQYGWPVRVQVAPGLHGNTAPFGLVEASAVAAHEAFLRGGDQQFDIGVVQLDGSDIGYTTGWLGVAVESDAELRSGALSVAGYPGDRDQGMVMYQQSGPTLDVNAELLMYEMDSFQGMSGGPVFRTTSGGAVLVGVHAWESMTYAFNGGTRVTQDKLRLVREWIAEGPHCDGGACERAECSEGDCSEGSEREPSQLPVSQPPSQPGSNQPYGWSDPYGPQSYEFACAGGGSTAWLWPLLALVGLGAHRSRMSRVR